jgi:leucyl-tRNA---protein transferase
MRQDDPRPFADPNGRKLRYFVTAPSPCPYVEGQVERKAFTHLGVPASDALHTALSQYGFRRSQTIAYRPACPTCNACRSVRTPVADFEWTRRWRRIMSRNAHIERTPMRNEGTREQYRLFRHYLEARHDGLGMSDMNYADYLNMVRSSPVRTLIFEYREEGRLVGASLTDVMRDGFSLVYSFFDPELAPRSVGNFIILDHIRHAHQLGLPFVYLGYWIPESPKMAYKGEFRPLEILAGDRWEPLDRD